MDERTKQWNEMWRDAVIVQFTPRIQLFLKDVKMYEPCEGVHSQYLYGKARTGKTVQAAKKVIEWCKAQYLGRKQMNFIFISVPCLLGELRETYQYKEKSEKEVMDRYKKVKLLVLDDLGAEKTTEWAYQMLYMIITHRYDYLLPTIYTSNFSLSELSKKLQDDRLTGRIAEDCKCSIFRFTNEPYL